MAINLTKAQSFDGRKFATVTIKDLGEVRLATFSARKALEFRKLLKRQGKGEDVELEMTRLMIVGSVVDDESKAVFNDATADDFMDKLTPDQAAALVQEVTKLQNAGVEAAQANPSQPSPSAA